MEIAKEAWIILYIWSEPSDWIGSFPSDHCQQYYTDQRKGLPKHFDSYQEAAERAEREYLYNYIIVPIAGEQAMKLQDDNHRLCNIPDVVKRACPMASETCDSESFCSEKGFCLRCD